MSLQGKNIRCMRGNRLLFDKLSFEVQVGEALHVFGPNGIGKSSLLQIMAGLLLPSRGKVFWKQQSIRMPKDYKSDLIFVGHQIGMRGQLTLFENLYLFLLQKKNAEQTSRISVRKQMTQAKAKIEQALAFFNLINYANQLTRLLSFGQQRRLCLAKLLLMKTSCWILDEPFIGLDNISVQLLNTLFKQQLKSGGIIIYTCHQTLSLKNLSTKQLNLSFFVDTNVLNYT